MIYLIILISKYKEHKFNPKNHENSKPGIYRYAKRESDIEIQLVPADV